MIQLQLGNNFFVRKLDELTACDREIWGQLLEQNKTLRQSFLSLQFAEAVGCTGMEVLILLIAVDSKPVFFLPLQRCKGMVGKLGLYEPVGGAMSDYFGAVAASGISIDPMQMLAATKGRVNGVLFTHLDQSQNSFGLLGGEPRKGLRTRLGVPPEAFWGNLRLTDKKLVYDTERREKKLVADHGSLHFEWESSHPETDLVWLVEAKRNQYERTKKQLAPLFILQNVELLNNLLKSKHPACHGVLSVLRSGDKIIAAHLGLRCLETMHVWFPVYDPQFASYSPGRILFKYLFAQGAGQGIELFDRGEGDNQAKRDFANEEHLYLRGFWHAGGWRGLLTKLAVGIAWRIGN